MQEFLKFLSSNIVSTLLGGVITWLVLKPKQKIDEAVFITNSYSKLYEMIKEQNDELEKHNTKLEKEIETRKRQEGECQTALAETKILLKEYGLKIEALEKQINDK